MIWAAPNVIFEALAKTAVEKSLEVEISPDLLASIVAPFTATRPKQPMPDVIIWVPDKITLAFGPVEKTPKD